MEVEKIGKFIAQLRHESHMTQEQLGQEIGVSNKTISRWETGVYLPPVDMIQVLCDVFNITVNEFLCGRRLDEMEYKNFAEENIKNVLKESYFGTEEKKQYFRKKWFKENLFYISLSGIVTMLLFVIGIVMDNGFQISAVLLLIYMLYFWNKKQIDYLKNHNV